MNEYHCSECGEPAYYDGRCGDGPILVCECRKHGELVDEGSRGTYIAYTARAVPGPGWRRPRWRDDSY